MLCCVIISPTEYTLGEPAYVVRLARRLASYMTGLWKLERTSTRTAACWRNPLRCTAFVSSFSSRASTFVGSVASNLPTAPVSPDPLLPPHTRRHPGPISRDVGQVPIVYGQMSGMRALVDVRVVVCGSRSMSFSYLIVYMSARRRNSERKSYDSRNVRERE